VTLVLTPESDGEVEVRGSRYPARSWDGTPIPAGAEIEVVDLEDGVLLVALPADAEQFSEDAGG
jgi:membrane-bound ClpP family serine protease